MTLIGDFRMKTKSAFITAVGSTMLLASLGLTAAQAAAPENRPSTTMEKDGGHSDLNMKTTKGRLPPYVHTGRSVYRAPHHHYRRVY
jgi:hypothetical protein